MMCLLLFAGLTIGGAVSYQPPGGSGHGGGREGKGKRQDRVQNGSYVATVRGEFRGTGTADVREDKVSLHLSVKLPDGRSGDIIADDLPCSGPYFSGPGTLFGEPLFVRGRLDAAKASRLTATFYTAGGTGGRIVGSLPGDLGDPSWNDENVNSSGSGDGN